MAFFYVDLDDAGGDDSGDSWANAALDIQAGFTAASAGDTVFVQGAAVDTDTGLRVLTSPGTEAFPCLLIGVKDGTTNEGTSVATSDLAIRGTDTLPAYTATGAGADIAMGGIATISGIRFDAVDRFQASTVSHTEFKGCEIRNGGLFFMLGGSMVFRNCEIEPDSTAWSILCRASVTTGRLGSLEIYGGVLTFTADPTRLLYQSTNMGPVLFVGVDLSGMGNINLSEPSANDTSQSKFVNCRFPATYTLNGTNFTAPTGCLELIASDDSAAVGDTSSIQDYQYVDAFGTIENEATKVRTGGSDDGATGLFSYKMTTLADEVLEGTYSALKSPPLAVWVDGGSEITLTVFIANDGAGDLDEDEIWAEFFTPSAGDVANHDLTISPNDGGELLNVGIVQPDDTGSTWGGSVGNHQKISVTLTPGFEGWAYCCVYLAKRQASPDPVYLDAQIEVT